MDILQLIEQKRNKLRTEKVDMSVGELVNLYKDAELLISPEYQRKYNWDSDKRCSFIETVILGIPFPAIFVAENEDGVWEIVDGQQRITTLIAFMGELSSNHPKYHDVNNFKLDYCDKITELEGFDFASLDLKIRLLIKRAPIRVEILKSDSAFDMRFEVFKRLNTQGLTLEDQEIRNAIYRPELAVLFENFSNLENDFDFQKLFSIQKKRIDQYYVHELVLRVFSLVYKDNYKNVNSNIRDSIDKFLDALKEDNEKNEIINNFFVRFSKFLNIIISIEGYQTFFKQKQKQFAATNFEQIFLMLFIEPTLENNIVLLIRFANELHNSVEFRNASNSKNASSKARIRARIIVSENILSGLLHETATE